MQHTSYRSAFPFADGVEALQSCTLSVGDRVWQWAREHAVEVAAHWDRASRANPRYFNGTVYLMSDVHVAGGALEGALLRTDFASYLYWRTQGFPETGVIDAFGSALMRTSDDHVLLGRQSAGNVNAGLVYLPAGFIDASDIAADGNVDIAKAVAREIAEETGLTAGEFVREPGFFAVRAGAQLSIAVPFRLSARAPDCVRVIGELIASSDDPELEAVVAVANRADIEHLALTPYTRALLETLFADA